MENSGVGFLMSVYTPVTAEQLINFLKFYRIGNLVEFRGIEDGIDNTNYFLKTTTGDYVLTLFETVNSEELPFFLELLHDLQQLNIECPQPQQDKEGHYFRLLQSKATAIFSRLKGRSVLEPSLMQCAAIGSELGKIHQAGLHFPKRRKNEMDIVWCRQTFANLQDKLSFEDKNLISTFFLNESRHTINSLPKGIIHADLFKDNVLFDEDKVSGILDFYLACYDDLLLDLAITTNDWCQHQGQLQAEKVKALVSAYQQQRPLTANEKKYWAYMLQKAALIFWLSRLENQYFPRKAELTVIKDPNIYKQIFIQNLQTQGV